MAHSKEHLDDSQTPFLSSRPAYRDSSESEDFNEPPLNDSLALYARQIKLLRRIIGGLTCACILLLGGFIAFYIHVETRPVQYKGLDLFPSEEDVIRFNRIKLPVKLANNSFVGDPSPELDHAWHGLFEDVNIRVTAQDLQHHGLNSLELADGSGDFIGQLGVHHELHCLKKVRQWIYRDYYHPELIAGSPEFTENKVHIDHCIELLRMSTMCRSDTSVSTFEWLQTGSQVVPTALDKAYHSCVDFDHLMGWVRARSVDLFDPDVLVKAGSEDLVL